MIEARLPLAKPPSALGSQVAALEGATVLIVDDDVRNIFALRTALEDVKVNVLAAESGAECLRLLAENPSIDVVLMDIMMPEMDGYETIRRVRAQERWASLPIIALTAKAMKGDRESSLEAGASEYVSKPVDIEQLLKLIAMWLASPAAHPA
jgi:CheY-like chemotaxis protein